MTEDLDTYEPSTPVERALAARFGMTVEEVQEFLKAFEEEFERIDNLQRMSGRNVWTW